MGTLLLRLFHRRIGLLQAAAVWLVGGGMGCESGEVVIPPPAVAAAPGDAPVNRETGLREQTVRLTNDTPATVPAYDVIVRGLPDGVEVYNASTRRSDGSWVVNIRQPLTPFSATDIVLEYYSPASLPGALTPQITAEVVLNPPDAGTSAFAIDRTRFLPGPPWRILLEFTAVPRLRYRVQYSSDGQSWQDSPIPVTAAGHRVQWIDRGPPAPGGTRLYRVKQIRRKGDRINLNAILQQGEWGRPFLTALFRLWGIEDNQRADDLFDNLLDWVDADSLSHHNGMEKEDYQAVFGEGTLYPFNRLFYSVSEIQLVAGFDAIVQQVPDWQDFFTVYSSGKVDLNAAPAKVLAAVAVAIRNPGDPVAEYHRLLESNEGANAIVQKRSGADGIEGTSDDKPLSESDWDLICASLDIPMPELNNDPKAQMVYILFGFNQ